MNPELLRTELQHLVRTHGPFDAQDMQLSEGIFTVDGRTNYDHFKLFRIKQILADLGYLEARGRALDIASLTGMFSIELALEGFDVVSVEGRDQNLQKAIFCAKALKADKIDFRLDDVNNICKESYGTFDVVLCMGILYHIDKKDYASFLKHISDCCSGVLIIDSFVSLHDDQTVEFQGTLYSGTTWNEFAPHASAEERKLSPHAALTNDVSFSMTKESLLLFLAKQGFETVMEVQAPQQPGQPIDRPTLVCLRGSRQSLKVFPGFDYRTDFATAADTRGTAKMNIAPWNASKRTIALRRKASMALQATLGDRLASQVRKALKR